MTLAACNVAKQLDDTILNMGSIQFTPISLPGHYYGQEGFLVNDTENNKKVFFLGDALFGMQMLKKYWIPYMIDPNIFLQSLKKVASIDADYYVPGHGEIYTRENLNAIIEMNVMVVLETRSLLLKLLDKTAMTHEELLESVADFSGIDLHLSQFVLIGSTLRSYLSCLKDEGLVICYIEDNRLLWKLNKENAQ